MKLLIIADIDDLHWKHDEGRADILLSCGDVADRMSSRMYSSSIRHRID